MLPEGLYDTYKQYKSDTSKIVQWLASTATNCGYNQPVKSAPATEPVKPTKLKGRARKLARDAATADTAAKRNGAVPLPEREVEDVKTHVVELEESVLMAEAISEVIVDDTDIDCLDQAVQTMYHETYRCRSMVQG